MVIKNYINAINIRIQPPGRAKQSLMGTLAAAQAMDDDTLVEISRYGLQWVNTYVDLRARRRIQRLARGEGEARTLDIAVDNFVGDIHRLLDRTPNRYPNHPERHAWAAELKATYFPDGSAPIVNLPYEEELVVVEYIHHHLTADHAAWCRALRIDGLLEDLGEILPAYRDALTPDDPITVDELNAAFDGIQHALSAAVAHVLGRYWRADEGEARDRLLRAIFDQDRRMAELLAARRRGSKLPLDLPTDEADGMLPVDGMEAEGAEPESPEAPAVEPAAPEPVGLQPLPVGDAVE